MTKILSCVCFCSNSWLLTLFFWRLSWLHISLGLSDRADILISFTCFEWNKTDFYIQNLSCFRPSLFLVAMNIISWCWHLRVKPCHAQQAIFSHHIKIALLVAFMNSAILYTLQYYHHLHLAFINIMRLNIFQY